MSEVRSHRDLIAWQKALAFGLCVYDATKSFPDTERYGLVSQLRRASVSTASNIAEGFGRGTTADYLRFLRSARGSLFEIDTQLLFSQKLGLVDATVYESLNSQWNECSKVLAGLIRSIENHKEH